MLLNKIAEWLTRAWNWVRWPIKWLWENWGGIVKFLVLSSAFVLPFHFVFGRILEFFEGGLYRFEQATRTLLDSADVSVDSPVLGNGLMQLAQLVGWLLRIDMLAIALTAIAAVAVGCLVVQVIRIIFGYFIG